MYCTHVCRRMYPVCWEGGQRRALAVLFYHPPSVFLSVKASLQSLENPILWLDWQPTSPRDAPVSVSLSARVTDLCGTVAGFKVGDGIWLWFSDLWNQCSSLLGHLSSLWKCFLNHVVHTFSFFTSQRIEPTWTSRDKDDWHLQCDTLCQDLEGACVLISVGIMAICLLWHRSMTNEQGWGAITAIYNHTWMEGRLKPMKGCDTEMFSSQGFCLQHAHVRKSER